ncbi:MAG TPA: phosphoribosylaminoimidazolesuccinocarboxamide synthase [Acidimicrobiales bacterium]|nr:phosphoribosylaminoimidazolesuccinocarboxamide synthase [Acidimicrobiales bacterium]
MTLDLEHLYSGKVRDIYRVGEDQLLMVASDRLSAFDVVMTEPIPKKGRVLTALTNYWVREFGADVATSLVTCDPMNIERVVPGFLDQRAWHGRATLMRRAEMLPLEFIVRGRLAGQAYEEYAASGTVHHTPMPPGMELTDAFAAPIFTPSTKADTGHDLNISFDEAAEIVDRETLERASTLCRDFFGRGAAAMARVGLVLADTKFELGLVDGELAFCDEVLTPDSSRIWPADQVRRGESPPSFDKQPFRDWLASREWNRTPPPPPVPDDVVTTTSRRYVECYERVTGARLSDWYGA